MPRYFFHLRDHFECLLDPQGKEIETEANIPALALSEARSLMSQDILSGSLDLRQRLEVEDQDSNLIYCLKFADAVRIIE